MCGTLESLFVVKYIEDIKTRTNTIGTGNCPKEETEGDAYQKITIRKRYHLDVECPHFELMPKTKRIDVRAGHVQMGHHRTLRDTR